MKNKVCHYGLSLTVQTKENNPADAEYKLHQQGFFMCGFYGLVQFAACLDSDTYIL